MRKLYHFCLSAGNEVMFRSEEDYIRGFNCYAVAVAHTGSVALADSIMSTHLHVCAESDDIKGLIYHYRTSYSRYFNKKYHRRGPLGEREPFMIDIAGVYHRLAALSYTLRNAVHHGVTPTPFAYPHNSSNAVFRTELGKSEETDLLPKRRHYHYLPDKAEIPVGYKMGRNGLLLRESVIDVQQVEYIYGSPRNFLFYMNRISGEEWEKEQHKDGYSALTLENMETGVKMSDVSAMLKNEYGRGNYKVISDIQLCGVIDNEMLPEYGAKSVYQLSDRTKCEIGNILWQTYRVGRDKIERCLAMNLQRARSCLR